MSLSIHSAHPLISVVIPTHNRALLLQKAIASVVAQTYNNWELIVVDDGSTDDTAETIALLNDPRIYLLSLPHCGNIASLRNAGMKVTSGEWIAFLDSDDEWTSYKLEIQLRLLQQQKKRWSYGGYELMNEASQTIPARSGIFRPISGWITAQILTCEAAVTIGSLMAERNLFVEAGGFNNDPKLLYREDYELVLRLSMHAEASAVPDLLLRIREHNLRSTIIHDDGHKLTAYVYQHFLNSKPGYKYEKIAQLRMAYHLAEISAKCMRNKKYAKAFLYLIKAFINGDKIRHSLSAINRGLKHEQ